MFVEWCCLCSMVYFMFVDLGLLCVGIRVKVCFMLFSVFACFVLIDVCHVLFVF